MEKKTSLKQTVLFTAIFLFGNSVVAQETAILEWVKKIGGTGTDRVRDLAIDPSGNVYISGFFGGTVDFDPGTATFNLTSTAGSAFAAKYDPSGNFIWAKSYGGSSAAGQGITVDASGNVYLTGGFEGTGDFDPGPAVFNMIARTTTESDIYILKLDVNGNFVWAKEIDGGTWFDHGYEIKLDAAGNVFVIGRFYYQGGPSFDFDPGPGVFLLTATHEDIFILKLDNNGNFVWARDIGAPTGADEHRGYSIAIDGTGNVYMTGYFEGTVDFDPGAGTSNLTASGDWDIFFTKFDNNGNFVWARRMLNSAPTYYTDGQYGSKIEVDVAGNVYTTGRYNGTVDFDLGAGTYNLTSNGGFDIYLLKMTTDGDFVWAKSMGATGNDEGFSLHTTSTGDSYVTGFFVNTVDFNPDAGVYNLTSAGSNDAFISKFDATGNLIWARSMGGTASDLGYGVAINSTGDVFLTGPFNGTADFDPSPSPCTNNQTSAGGEDIFIVKLNQVATLSITSTSVASGSFGETVIITGTGFSDIPGNNVVEFNNTVATVTASTTTSITTSVPAGATTGPIEVTVACATVASGTNFTVFTGTINITLQPSDVTVCPGDITTFTTAATGTTNITYQWQVSTDGTTFNDISNDSNYSGVTTATLSLNTMGNFGEGRYQCRVNGDFAAEVLTTHASLFFDSPANCNNQPPVIEAVTTAVTIEGIVTIDLLVLISDPDNNLDLPTLSVVGSTSEQGAAASINATSELVLNYSGVLFTGTDHVTIEVCDLSGVCVQQELAIEVVGDVIIYNAISPNSNDNLNAVFTIQYIEVLPDTEKNRVTIYNRWGDVVFEISDYNNDDRVFRGVSNSGNDLTSGTYYYKVEFTGGRKTKTGYLSLKR